MLQVAAALLALTCDELRVFGFRDFNGPYHYWDDFAAWSSAPAPPPLSPLLCPFADGDSVLGYVGMALPWLVGGAAPNWWHDFSFEHSLLARWEAEGLTANVCEEEEEVRPARS